VPAAPARCVTRGLRVWEELVSGAGVRAPCASAAAREAELETIVAGIDLRGALGGGHLHGDELRDAAEGAD
jgi:hypothetical protein